MRRHRRTGFFFGAVLGCAVAAGAETWTLERALEQGVVILLVPAPLALALGIMAVCDIRKSQTSPHPKYGMGRAVFGIVLGGLFTALLIVLVLSVWVVRISPAMPPR